MTERNRHKFMAAVRLNGVDNGAGAYRGCPGLATARVIHELQDAREACDGGDVQLIASVVVEIRYPKLGIVTEANEMHVPVSQGKVHLPRLS